MDVRNGKNYPASCLNQHDFGNGSISRITTRAPPRFDGTWTVGSLIWLSYRLSGSLFARFGSGPVVGASAAKRASCWGRLSGRPLHLHNNHAMSPFGASRHVAAARQFGRFWTEADIRPSSMRTRPSSGQRVPYAARRCREGQGPSTSSQPVARAQWPHGPGRRSLPQSPAGPGQKPYVEWR